MNMCMYKSNKSFIIFLAISEFHRKFKQQFDLCLGWVLPSLFMAYLKMYDYNYDS